MQESYTAVTKKLVILILHHSKKLDFKRYLDEDETWVALKKEPWVKEDSELILRLIQSNAMEHHRISVQTSSIGNVFDHK